MAAPLLIADSRGSAARVDAGQAQPTLRPPEHAECAGVWETPVPTQGSPGVWLLGAHGGAGVSTLCRWIGPAGDAQGRWPGGHGGQSPFVVLVAEESVTGLKRAHALVRQHATGRAGERTHLLGVVTVARVPGRRPQQVRQRRDVLAGLLSQISAGPGRMWSVPFVSGLTTVDVTELPVWSIGDPAAPKKRATLREAVPAPVVEFATDVVECARSEVAAWSAR